VAAQLDKLVTNNLPMDDWQTYADDVDGVSEKEIARLVRRHVRADDLVFVIVGDWKKISEELGGLDRGEVQLLAK